MKGFSFIEFYYHPIDTMFGNREIFRYYFHWYFILLYFCHDNQLLFGGYNGMERLRNMEWAMMSGRREGGEEGGGGEIEWRG